jgi:uncharacterized coiled-coil protein SlyX
VILTIINTGSEYTEVIPLDIDMTTGSLRRAEARARAWCTAKAEGIAESEKEKAGLEQRNAELEQKKAELGQQGIAELEQRIAELEQRIAELEQLGIAGLEQEIAGLKKMIARVSCKASRQLLALTGIFGNRSSQQRVFAESLLADTWYFS